MEAEGPGGLFTGVVFSIVPSDDLNNDTPLGLTKLVELATSLDGQYIPFWHFNNDSRPFTDLTHIVSTSIDFPRYGETIEKGIDVVKPTWVVHSAKKNRVTGVRQYSPDPSQFFQDVVLSTAGLPEADKDAIVVGVLAFGGIYSSPLSKTVTHLVAPDMTPQLVQVALEKGVDVAIVLPHWFDDCLRLGRKISDRPYRLPNPEYLSGQGTKIADVPAPQIEGATVISPTTPPSTSLSSSPSEQRRNLNVFMSKKVMLGADLQLTDHLLKTLEDLIKYAGAELTSDAEEADIYIGHFRDGVDYITVSRARKEVGNLSWLYHVLNTNRYTSPLSRLLHYPVPRGGLPGFDKLVISISNYTGDARTYLISLVEACGAEFTKTMKQQNTHLITAHTQSEKCQAAQEWNVNLVNHIWLEESYAKCEAQSLTNARFTHFPTRTHLSEVVGQTRFDMQKLEQTYYPEPRKTPRKAVASPHGAKKPNASTSKTTTKPQSSVLNGEIQSTNVTTPQTVKKARGRPSKAAATPRIRDVMDDEKENESPLPRSSERASKVKANGAIHNYADDIALYEKERKRKGGVTHGGRRSSRMEEHSSPAPEVAGESNRRKKRVSDEATYDVTAQGSDLSDGETQAKQKPAKKAKRTSATPTADLPPVQYKMMVTGDERWIDNANKESQDRFKLRQLGVQLTQEAREVDILVAPKILRTRKFVSALASAPTVVDTSYLDYALKQKKLKESPSTLQDRDAEDRLGFKLCEALARAEINDGNLLRGWHIYITKDVSPGFETYKEIVTLNGGSAYLYNGRSMKLSQGRAQHVDEAGPEAQHQGSEDGFEYAYLVSGVTSAEKRQCKTFCDMASKQGQKARVVKNDWLLHAAMAQQIEWRDEFALGEGDDA